jgi:hypothetical protein
MIDRNLKLLYLMEIVKLRKVFSPYVAFERRVLQNMVFCPYVAFERRVLQNMRALHSAFH